MVGLLPPPDCPACGRPMQRRRKTSDPSDLQFVCSDAACRSTSEIAARWIANLKPPSS